MNLNYKHVSFEGERGTGKTTVISSLINQMQAEGLSPVLNREIDAKYKAENSPNHERSIELYELWQTRFNEIDGGIEVNNPEATEVIAFERFHNVVINLLWEGYIHDQIISENDIFICDRDLDTVVAYGAVEIILSNPQKYSTEESRVILIDSLWRMVLSVRQLPELTFYMTSDELESKLTRSYLSKQSTQSEYQLTAMQRAMQNLVKEIFPLALSARQAVFPGRLIEVNVDGKRPDEVFNAIKRAITMHKALLQNDTSKNLLNLNFESTFEAPQTLEELIELIMNSSTGAAFPSYEEVQTLGFSNCVYNNAALAYYSNLFGLANIELVSVNKDAATETSSVHWVCIQHFDNNTARIIDLSPFNSKPLIGRTTLAETIDNGVTLLNNENPLDSELDLIALEVQSEDPQYAFQIMQFAHDSQVESNDKQLIETGKQLLKHTKNESQEVFVSVRLIRVLERMGRLKKIMPIINSLITKYKNNLILGREIARLKESEFEIEGCDEYLNDCIKTIALTVQKRLSDLQFITQKDEYLLRLKEIESFIKYYEWIYKVQGFNMDTMLVKVE